MFSKNALNFAKISFCKYSKKTSKDDGLSNLLKKLESKIPKSQSGDLTKSLFSGLKFEAYEDSRTLMKKENPVQLKSSEWLSRLAKRRLGIFKDISKMPDAEEESGLFARLEEVDRLASIEVAPRNAFEEMILWTKQGKVWNFPINNEQGMGEESQVSFHEHIYLEKNLSDFPSKGPLRQFMELVLIGLSKNAYLSVREKQEHIEWYKNYFKENEHLWKESPEGKLA